MARKSTPTPKSVTPDTIDPRHRWDRPLQAPGHMPVDFEERVDFRRLQGYRLARGRHARAPSGRGPPLGFEQYNIPYISSTGIGARARAQLTRRAPLTRHRAPR